MGGLEEEGMMQITYGYFEATRGVSEVHGQQLTMRLTASSKPIFLSLHGSDDCALPIVLQTMNYDSPN